MIVGWYGRRGRGEEVNGIGVRVGDWKGRKGCGVNRIGVRVGDMEGAKGVCG